MSRVSLVGQDDSDQEIVALMAAADKADRERNYRIAVMYCGQALFKDPNFLPAKILSAVVHLKSGFPEAAEEKFLAILKAAPDCYPAYLWLGTMYSRNGRLQDAITMAREATELKPADRDARFLLARSLFEMGDLTGAETQLRQILLLRGHHPEAHSMLGTILQQLGDMEEAEAHLRRAIQLEPHVGPPYFDLVLGRKITHDDQDLIQQFEIASRVEGLRPRDRSRVEFALGKAYDDLAEYGKAIAHYDVANQLALEAMTRSGVVFNPEKMAEDFRVAKESSQYWDRSIAGSSSEIPVFIVGMMRSGTTLLEQIVSRHSEVAGAGEMNYWFDRVGGFHAEHRAPTASEAQALAADSLVALKQFGPHAKRITDKTPHNFITLGWIHSIFPNARFIHCRRKLIDSCLSIYMTPFRVSPEFGHRRENIVTFARHYEQLMAHWREVLPPERFLEVDYEELVANPEVVTREIISFLGLSWQDECLQPNLNTKVVRTPSLWQVRQPIYRGSVDRWRRYEPWLGVFKELL